jgi:ATP-dependent DNA helicase RecG
MDGTQIEVNLYPDRLEIVSPGSLLSRAFLANERQLSSIPPMRRNKMICEVFSWFGIMDKRGSGFDKIEEDYHGKGDAYQPYASSDEASFTLVLPDLSHQGGLISQNPLPELTTALPMKGKDDLKICSFAFNGAKTASEIAAMLGITPSSYFRSNTLQRLVREGYLIEDKSSHPSKFSTNRMNFTLV